WRTGPSLRTMLQHGAGRLAGALETAALDPARRDGRSVLCACVDIGSNTTRLLVAETGTNGFREILAQRCFTRLGAGTGPDGSIAREKLQEVAEVVAAQAAASRELGVARLRVVATAAIRHAPNRDALVEAIARAAG